MNSPETDQRRLIILTTISIRAYPCLSVVNFSFFHHKISWNFTDSILRLGRNYLRFAYDGSGLGLDIFPV